MNIFKWWKIRQLKKKQAFLDAQYCDNILDQVHATLDKIAGTSVGWHRKNIYGWMIFNVQDRDYFLLSSPCYRWPVINEITLLLKNRNVMIGDVPEISKLNSAYWKIMKPRRLESVSNL